MKYKSLVRVLFCAWSFQYDDAPPFVSRIISQSGKLLPNGYNITSIRKFMSTIAMPPPPVGVKITSMPLDKNDHRRNNTNEEFQYRMYTTREMEEANDDVIFWIHGGGFLIGTLCQDDIIASQICELTNKTVISLSYGLAPENPYPQGLNDIVNIIKKLDTDGYCRGNIILLGESAGANLCLATYYKLTQDPHAVAISSRITKIGLIYPPIIPSARTRDYSHSASARSGLLTFSSLKYIYKNYIQDTSKLDFQEIRALFPIYYIPTTTVRNSGVKILLLLASFDILYNQNIAFYNKSKTVLGDSITLKVYPDIHGFFGRFGHGASALQFLTNWTTNPLTKEPPIH
jgi:acetyl esterase